MDRKFAIAGLIVALLGAAAGFAAQDATKYVADQHHDWLKQFVGEWEAEAEVTLEPGQPSQKNHGTETVRTIGGLWIVADGKVGAIDQPIVTMLTLGYDPHSKKYVGTWIDSTSSYLWKYEGTLDPDGKVLTLATEGPDPATPGRMTQYKDAYEFKSKDHKVIISSALGEDGKWVTYATVNYRRKK